MIKKQVIKTPYSFKDPSAQVHYSNGKFVRYVHFSYRKEFKHLMHSGLYDELVSQKLMITHVESELELLPNGYFTLLIPDQIQYMVKPFEWTFSTWKKVALGILKINQIALKYGMILKDASPYNFCMHEGNHVLFDTTSFEFFEENDSWGAYRQFCQEILGPLTLIKYNGMVWGRLSRAFIRGLSLEIISKQLSIRSYFNLQTLIHIHIHSKIHSNEDDKNRKIRKYKGFKLDAIFYLFSFLEKGILKWNRPFGFPSTWAQYYEKDVGSMNYLSIKKSIVSSWLDEIKPFKTTDLGSNTGEFSLLAAQYSSHVLAIESDPVCVEIFENEITKLGIKNVFTCIADLTQLSPDIGNDFKEIRNLGIRGHADCVLALAIMHHLSITYSYTFDHLFLLFKRFTTRYLLVEYVPKNDPQTQSLLTNLVDFFELYSQEHFEMALLKSFNILEKKEIGGSKRTLYFAELIQGV